MVKLHFKTTEEFDGLFKRKTLSVTRSIVQGIESAMQNNKRTAPPASARITSQAKNVGKIKFRLSEPFGPKNSANLGFTIGRPSFQESLFAEVPAPQKIKKR